MNWEHYVTRQVGLLQPSPVRQFAKYAYDPKVISFAGGLPSPELFPEREIAKVSAALMNRLEPALQYGITEGLAELREILASESRKKGIAISSENVLITSGAQQALDLLGRMFLEENSVALVENPTYLALLSCWRALGTTFEGVSPRASLEEIESKLKLHPQVLYLIPNFQNPSGETLPLPRRSEILESCRKYQVPLIEDDAYGSLRYQGEDIPSFLQMEGTAEGQVIQVGTFSKIIAPGLRVGWIIAPAELIQRLVCLKQAMDLHTSTFAQYLVVGFLQRNFLPNHLLRLREGYRVRLETMHDTLLGVAPPAVYWSRPEGGMFVLVHLPEHLSAKAFAAAALERNVAVVPGKSFHLQGGENTLRFNFSHPTPERIREGIQRLEPLFKSSSYASNSAEAKMPGEANKQLAPQPPCANLLHG